MRGVAAISGLAMNPRLAAPMAVSPVGVVVINIAGVVLATILIVGFGLALAIGAYGFARRELVVWMRVLMVDAFNLRKLVVLVPDLGRFHPPARATNSGDDLVVVLATPGLSSLRVCRPVQYEGVAWSRNVPITSFNLLESLFDGPID